MIAFIHCCSDSVLHCIDVYSHVGKYGYAPGSMCKGRFHKIDYIHSEVQSITACMHIKPKNGLQKRYC